VPLDGRTKNRILPQSNPGNEFATWESVLGKCSDEHEEMQESEKATTIIQSADTSVSKAGHRQEEETEYANTHVKLTIRIGQSCRGRKVFLRCVRMHTSLCDTLRGETKNSISSEMIREIPSSCASSEGVLVSPDHNPPKVSSDGLRNSETRLISPNDFQCRGPRRRYFGELYERRAT
jgi:hypothetical protein